MSDVPTPFGVYIQKPGSYVKVVGHIRPGAADHPVNAVGSWKLSSDISPEFPAIPTDQPFAAVYVLNNVALRLIDFGTIFRKAFSPVSTEYTIPRDCEWDTDDPHVIDCFRDEAFEHIDSGISAEYDFCNAVWDLLQLWNCDEDIVQIPQELQEIRNCFKAYGVHGFRPPYPAHAPELDPEIWHFSPGVVLFDMPETPDFQLIDTAKQPLFDVSTLVETGSTRTRRSRSRSPRRDRDGTPPPPISKKAFRLIDDVRKIISDEDTHINLDDPRGLYDEIAALTFREGWTGIVHWAPGVDHNKAAILIFKLFDALKPTPPAAPRAARRPRFWD